MKAEEQQVLTDLVELAKELTGLRVENKQLKERVIFLEAMLLTKRPE